MSYNLFGKVVGCNSTLQITTNYQDICLILLKNSGFVIVCECDSTLLQDLTATQYMQIQELIWTSFNSADKYLEVVVLLSYI